MATDFGTIGRAAQVALSSKHDAREQALPRSRAAIRCCANAVRATHRGEYDVAAHLLEEARQLINAMHAELHTHPDVLYAGFVADAQKEMAEAFVTLAIIQGLPIPGPSDLGVDWPAYLNGLGEAVGELRRHVLDELRRGHPESCEAILEAMDEILGVLTALDFPDAITNNLRRTTDAARSITEKTRGDLTLATVQLRIAREIAHASGQLDRTIIERRDEPVGR